AIAAAGLVWRGDTYLIQSEPWMALALLASGAALIAMGAMNREEPTTPRTRMLIAALAVAAACAFALIIASGTDALALHRGAREWPSATVLMLGLAGALAFSRSKRVRYAAAPVACAGLAAWFLGSTTFLVRF